MSGSAWTTRPAVVFARTPTDRDPNEETAGANLMPTPPPTRLASGARSRESYFSDPISIWARDCGLSVFRLRQVEKTALDKLRGFLAPSG